MTPLVVDAAPEMSSSAELSPESVQVVATKVGSNNGSTEQGVKLGQIKNSKCSEEEVCSIKKLGGQILENTLAYDTIKDCKEYFSKDTSVASSTLKSDLVNKSRGIKSCLLPGTSFCSKCLSCVDGCDNCTTHNDVRDPKPLVTALNNNNICNVNCSSNCRDNNTSVTLVTCNCVIAKPPTDEEEQEAVVAAARGRVRPRDWQEEHDARGSSTDTWGRTQSGDSDPDGEALERSSKRRCRECCSQSHLQQMNGTTTTSSATAQTVPTTDISTPTLQRRTCITDTTVSVDATRSTDEDLSEVRSRRVGVDAAAEMPGAAAAVVTAHHICDNNNEYFLDQTFHIAIKQDMGYQKA